MPDVIKLARRAGAGSTIKAKNMKFSTFTAVKKAPFSFFVKKETKQTFTLGLLSILQ